MDIIKRILFAVCFVVSMSGVGINGGAALWVYVPCCIVFGLFAWFNCPVVLDRN